MRTVSPPTAASSDRRRVASRTDGLAAVDGSRPLGRWNARPEFSPREAGAQRAQGVQRAAEVAARAMVPLAQLRDAHGADLAQMPAAELREQLAALQAKLAAIEAKEAATAAAGSAR